MTQTKVTKTIAIVLAMVMAFALMSVTLTNSAKAATKVDGTGYTFEIQNPVVIKSNDKENWYASSTASYEAGEVPLITVSVKYTNKDGKMFTDETKLEDALNFYQDDQEKAEVKLPPTAFADVKVSAEEVSFTLDLKGFTGLLDKGVNYIKFNKKLTATEAYEGDDIYLALTLPGTKTTSSSSSTTKSTSKRTTYSYSYRTISTRSTTRKTVSTTNRRVNPANTDDPSHMPLWVAIAILAAGGTGIAYVWKQRD